MKANVLHGVGDLRFQEIPRPKPTTNEVIIKVHASGICGSDVARVHESGTYSFPMVIGHEFSGEIVEIGEAVDPKFYGRRVAVFPLIPCKTCVNCAAGTHEMCVEYDYLGSRSNGGFAEYVVVPAWNVMIIAEQVSYEEAAMFEPAAVAVHALRQARFKAGDTVAIFGVGTIGLIIAQVAKALDAKKVLLITHDDRKLDFATRLGFSCLHNSRTSDAQRWVSAQTDNVGADIVVEGTGVSAILSTCLEAVRHAGTVLALGNPVGEMRIDKKSYSSLLRRQLLLIGTWNSSFKTRNSDWDMVAELLRSRRLDLRSLITHRFTLSELSIGLQSIMDPRVLTVKVMTVN